MAYAAAKTYSMTITGGRRCLLVTVLETEAAATSEFSLDLGGYLPAGTWKLVRFKQIKTAGSAATTAPVFGTATNPTSGTADYIGTDAAAATHDATNSGAGWVGDGATLYVRSVVNAGADNSITSKFYLIDGWQ